MLSKEHRQEVAETILQQLGGRQFVVMTGSKDFCSGEDSEGRPYLYMKLSKNRSKANVLRITLDFDDTYTVVFKFLRGCRLNRKTGEVSDAIEKVIAEYEGMYFDMLQDIFEEVTGLYCTLYPRNEM